MTSPARRDSALDAPESDTGLAVVPAGQSTGAEDKALPLPGWLTKLYFIFPIILYVPDAIFNYYVYSDGITPVHGSVVEQAFWSVIWGFVAVGVVGMAYLLSVLAPWHWSQGHRFQALFCAIGVVVATLITTWNSLAFRSQDFSTFPTDKWAYDVWPQLHAMGFSLTMVLVAVAPPFWGLFWAIVQPTEKNRNLRHLQESHAERIMRAQQEAELKRIKAEVNAKVREAQLRGMAQTAAAARQQAAGFIGQRRQNGQTDGEVAAVAAPAEGENQTLALDAPAAESAPASQPVEHTPTPLFTPNRNRDLTVSGRPGREMYNHAASAPVVRAEPNGAAAVFAQPSLMGEAVADAYSPEADVMGSSPARPRPTVGNGIAAFFPGDSDVTGTTGPRPAVRRVPEPSQLLRVMNEPQAPVVKQVELVIADLRAAGVTKPAPRDVVPALMERYSVDEEIARRMVTTYKSAQKSNRS